MEFRRRRLQLFRRHRVHQPRRRRRPSSRHPKYQHHRRGRPSPLYSRHHHQLLRRHRVRRRRRLNSRPRPGHPLQPGARGQPRQSTAGWTRISARSNRHPRLLRPVQTPLLQCRWVPVNRATPLRRRRHRRQSHATPTNNGSAAYVWRRVYLKR